MSSPLSTSFGTLCGLLRATGKSAKKTKEEEGKNMNCFNMKRGVLTSALALALLGLCGFSSTASADTIFQDNFNRSNSNTVGNGWTETQDDADDVAINNNRLLLRSDDPNAIAAQLSINTTGFNNIRLSYDWAKLSGDSESDDELIVEWKLGSSGSWTELEDHGLGGSSSFSSNSELLSGAANQGDVEFRFRLDVSNGNEGVLIDNVLLTGDKIQTGTGAVPEPSSFVLLGFGLLGAGWFSRRMKHAA
jgi:hypothetical protein